MTQPTLSPVEQLNQSKQKLAALAERRTRVQVQLEAARQQLSEARVQAETEYGTADVARLREILAERDKANTAAAEQFQLAVTEFESFLTRIEQALANPAAMAPVLMPAPAAVMPPVPGSEDI